MLADPTGLDARMAGEPRRPRGLGLSGKLLGLTFLFVMLAEILIFVPSVANFRITWLSERVAAAHLASLAAKAAPDGRLPPMLRDELLKSAQVRVISIRQDDKRNLILSVPMPGRRSAPMTSGRRPADQDRRCGRDAVRARRPQHPRHRQFAVRRRRGHGYRAVRELR